MRISILSLFLAVALALGGQLALADEASQKEMMGPEQLTETVENTVEDTQTAAEETVVDTEEVIIEAEAGEDCANGADDDGDQKVDCDDEDCAGDPGCKSGY